MSAPLCSWEIPRLAARYLELCDSAENCRRRDYGGVRYMVMPEFPVLAELTGARLGRSYLDPEEFVRFTLAQRIFRFERWRDCTPLTKDIAYWPGVILETAAFGMQPVYLEKQDPWNPSNPIVRSLADVERLDAPLDATAGLMKTTLDISEYARTQLPGLQVYVQAWDRAALGIAFDLLGSTRFLLGTIEEPDLIRALMDRITACSFRWMDERKRVLAARGFPLDSSISPGTGSGSDMLGTRVNIVNDELNKPMISPAAYAEFIHPYEARSVEHFGGLNYYHSCGCLTPFLKDIAAFRPATQHVSYWTDLSAAVEVYAGAKTHIQKTLHPLRDVLECDRSRMVAVLREIKGICGEAVNYSVVANGINVPSGRIDRTLAACDEWVKAAAEVFGDPQRSRESVPEKNFFRRD